MLISFFTISIIVSTTVDIKGYCYYISNQDYYYYFAEEEYAEGKIAVSLDNSTVTLFSRSSSFGWNQYGSSVLSDDGYYVFEDIDIGQDPGDLCANSDWFMICFDASNHLPQGWSYPAIQYRFSHNTVRPDGTPDEGSIRVDCVLFDTDYVVYNGSSVNVFEAQGHWVTESDGTMFSVSHGEGYGTCPIEQNTISIGSCLVGHWHNGVGLTRWSDEDDYARYVFWPTEDESGDIIVWCYTYWTMPWPSYAMHRIGTEPKLYLVSDYVYFHP